MTSPLTPGLGIWLVSQQAPGAGVVLPSAYSATQAPISAPVTPAQGCAVPTGCISVALTNVAGANRYNLVGNPFPFAVDWSLVRVRIDGAVATLTPSAALAAGYASNVISIWNGSRYAVYNDVSPIGNIPSFGAIWTVALSGGAGHTVELLIPNQATTHP